MINFSNRLKSLKDRRQGSRERAIFESYGMESFSAKQLVDSGFDSRDKDFFEKIQEADAIKYAIGAMAAVDKKYTEISKREGERVADSLIKSLSYQGESVTKRLQGSVALDIHIKGHSDVDMLIIVAGTIWYQTPAVSLSRYCPPSDPRPLLDIMRDVRNKSEGILPSNFPKAKVDSTGNKSIALSEGSLLRKVDVVPAVWYDCLTYQSTGLESDRGVYIYHKRDHARLLNYPFLHIKKINDQDAMYAGNLKRVIRLMKNLIADMPEYKKTIAKRLSSYDLASIAYHMSFNLFVPKGKELGLIEKARVHLNNLLNTQAYRESLDVPDGSRKIFDNDEKVEALEVLAKECGDLADSIFYALSPSALYYDPTIIVDKSIAC